MNIKRKKLKDTLLICDGDTELLAMKETLKDGCVLIELKGSLTNAVEFNFQDELMALATLGLSLLVDFKEVAEISVGCQQVLHMVQQAVESSGSGQMVIVNLCPEVKAAFEDTGLYWALMIEE